MSNLCDYCCVCNNNNSVLIKISETDTNQEKWSNKLNLCVPSVIWSEDACICPNCIEQLEIAHTFYQLCIQSDEVRKQQASCTIKIEPCESKEIFDCDNEINTVPKKEPPENLVKEEFVNVKIEKGDFCLETMEEEEFDVDVTEDILVKTRKTHEDLLPTKSKPIYDKQLKLFVDWKLRNAVTDVNETTMLAYFQELSEKYMPNSLWTKYSILKSALIVNDNIDISRYNRLVSFLKQRSKGYIPKKSKVLTGDQVLTFMKDAPNETYLFHKVVLVMGVFGGLGRHQMVKMTVDDIQDKGCVLLVKIPETTNGFTIVEEEEIGALRLVQKYASLRPKGISERRFFLAYKNNRCTAQPVGKNSLGSVPTIIAKYLELDNAKEYTGHCLRRTSSTLLVEASKNRIAHMIASSVGSFGENGKGKSSSSMTSQGEKTTFDTSEDFHNIQSSEESIIGKNSKEINVGSVSFSGKLGNCRKDFNK